MHNGLEQLTAYINIYIYTYTHIYIHTNTVTSQCKSFVLQARSKRLYC